MRVVVFEDDPAKCDEILGALVGQGVGRNSVRVIETLAQFAELDTRLPVDLFILDLRMPGVTGGPKRNVGLELLAMLEHSGRTRTPVLAISAYPDEAESMRDRFAQRGCIIFDFDRKSDWQNALKIFLAQAQEKGRYDFVIFTALEKERAPYVGFKDLEVRSEVRHGLNAWETEIGGKPGVIFLLPNMGLVNASIVVSRVLESYSPAVVAMSGICAGISDEALLGQLLVADFCWEYQSGKWLDEMFAAEPYQAKIAAKTRPLISQALEDAGLVTRLEATFSGTHRPPQRPEPTLAVFATGSAVIASEERLKNIQAQHRKVRGLDMEAFGFMRAVEMSGKDMHAFCAKVVVDKANLSKGDELHPYGTHLSARFTVDMIATLLEASN